MRRQEEINRKSEINSIKNRLGKVEKIQEEFDKKDKRNYWKKSIDYYKKKTKLTRQKSDGMLIYSHFVLTFRGFLSSFAVRQVFPNLHRVYIEMLTWI